MAPGNEIQDPDLILANSTWLKGFTRRLVRDAELAEDLSQEVLLAGLSAPDSSTGGPSRPWLARVARNIAIRLARRESRRQQAEKAATPGDPAPETAELVGEAELQGAAVHALLDLHEPYRTTLLQRYMKGLSWREMAKRSGVPVETIRTRIKRGLTLMRAKLDQEHGGRRGWLVPIGIPALPFKSTRVLWGIILMKAKAKALLAASLLLAGMFGIWYFSNPPGSGLDVPQPDAGGTLAADLAVQTPPADAEERNPLDPVSTPPAEVEVASLLVRVTWQDTGEPAAHVGLHVAEERWASLGHLASTGEDGMARFEGLEPGKFTVNMDRLTTTANRERDVELAAGELSTLELEVPRGLDVRGVVVDPEGLPVSDAEILVLWAAVAPQWPFPTTRTDEYGAFFLRSLGALNLIGARTDGRGTSSFALVQAAERGAPGEVLMRLVLPGSPAELTGTVYDPEGKPVAGAWVGVGAMGALHVLPDGGTGQGTPRMIVRTDAQGAFDVSSLQPGTKPVRVYAQGFAVWKGEVECLPSGTASMSIQLQRGASLFGQISDGEGRPLEGVRITISELRYPQITSVRSDVEGRYRIEDLPGGELSVVVNSAESGIVRNALQFALGQGRRWDVSLEPGLVIRGILVDQSGQPLEGWWVRGDNGPSGVTDREGRFLLSNLEARPYDLGVYQTRMLFIPRIRTLEDEYPGGPEQTYVVPEEAMPTAWIRGRVLDPEGRPVRDVALSLSLYQGDSYVGSNTKPDSEGRFEIGPLPPGAYSLTGYYPDCLAADFGEIILVPNEVRQLADARLAYGARIDLTLRSTTPEQLEGLEVEVVDAEGRRVREGILQGTKFAFPVLPPGSHKLSIKGPTIETQLLPIELRAQETLSLEIDLR